MARKKIVFIIVEGPSDSTALGAIFNGYFDSSTVHVHVMHSDITSDSEVTPSNIVAKVTNAVKQYARNNHFTVRDFEEIIHVVDTDGAFIPDEKVVEDPNKEHPYYTLDKILTKDRFSIIHRNHRKATNIQRLYGCRTLWNSIPYRVFYMSCNLDHVLYNKLNSSDAEKEDDALHFAKQYKNNIDGFIRFISSPEILPVANGYRESWLWIQEDGRSLQRYTNLGYGFPVRKEANISQGKIE